MRKIDILKAALNSLGAIQEAADTIVKDIVSGEYYSKTNDSAVWVSDGHQAYKMDAETAKKVISAGAGLKTKDDKDRKLVAVKVAADSNVQEGALDFLYGDLDKALSDNSFDKSTFQVKKKDGKVILYYRNKSFELVPTV